MTVTGFYPTTTTLATSGSAGAYTLTATTTSYSNLPSYPYGTMDFEDASNANYLFGTGSVGSGSYAQVLSLSGTNSTSAAPQRSASADFNSDGKPDLVLSTSGNVVSVFLGNGDGTFTAASGSPISTGTGAVAVAVGDFNGDGNPDIAVTNYTSGTVSILLGNGDGTFTTGTSITGLNEPNSIATADVNNDGNLDLMVTSQNGNDVYVYLGNGAGTFTLKGTSACGTAPLAVVAADFNGDGNLDLAVANEGTTTVTILLGTGTGTFTAASGSPRTVGSNPWNLVAVDLNNDGKVDLVASDSGDAKLSILLGNGDGTFAGYTTYTLASGTKELVAGDFNEDGDMDIAVCNSSNNSLSIAQGDGNGSFYTGASATLASTGCLGLAVADFNGDGLPDIQAGLGGNNTSVVFINQIEHSASASFGPGAIPGYGSHNIFASYPQDFANATSSSANTAVTATPSTTTLTLSAAPTSSTYSQQVALSATLSPYLIGSESTAGETITFYNGGSSIGTANLATGLASLNVTSLPVGTDSLTASYPGDSNFNASTSSALSYTVSKITPTITWSAPTAITYGTALSGTQLNASSGGVAGTFVYTPAAGTVLNVGPGQTLSVAFTPTDTTHYNSASGTTTITVNKATPTVSLATSATSIASGSALTLTATVTAGATLVSPGTIVFCNAAATRCADSAVIGRAQLTSSGTAAFKFFPGAGSFSYKAVFQGDTNCITATSSSVAVTVTHSGLYATTTAITSSGSAGAYTLTGTVSTTTNLATYPTGTVTFKDSTNGNYVLGSASLGSGSSVVSASVSGTNSVATTLRISAVADFNGDGNPDIVATTQNNVGILLGNGNGTFTAASGSPVAVGSNPVGVATGDFNGDGFVDIVTANHGSNDVSVLLGHGDGTFAAGTTISGISGASFIAVSDLNGDGNLDFAVTSQNNSTVCVYLGNGAGGFTAKGCNSTGSSPYSIAIGDFNGDGFPDITVGNVGASTVTILLGDGTGNYTAASGSPVTVGSQPQSVFAVDLNGDGKVDIVASDNGDANVSILKGNGDGTFAAFTSYGLATGLKYMAIGDFNADGVTDLAVCNYGTSTVAIALGNGDATFQSASLSNAGSGSCQGIAVADFNRDGLSDVQVSLNGNGTSTVLLSTVTRSASASISSVSIPGNGSHNVFAAYGADSNDAASTSSNIALTASPITTTLTLTAAPTSDSYGQSVTLTATLSPYAVGGLTTAGETITFKSGGTTIGTGTLSSGVATLTISSLTAGSDALTAVYATDSNFLGSTSNTVTYAVAKITPTITWSAPSAITYGTALSGTQLNASSGGVAGTFVYTPASGTVLNAGAGQTLSVTFTPTDTTDYNSVTQTTTITVNQATKTITFPQPTTPVAVGTSATLTATASGGDPVTYTVTSGTASISGTTVTYTNSGTVTIAANSSATTNYAAAATVSDSVTVNMAASAYTAPTTSVGATSATQTAMVNIATAGTLNTISVLTQGVSGLGYVFVSGGTCSTGTAYTVGQACSVQYTFAPKYPGQRLGAVSLTTSTGQLLGVSYLSGVGLGPLLALTPAVISTVAGNGSSGYSGDGGAATSAQINAAYRAIRDTVGNVYIADANNHVVRKVTASTGFISTVAGTGTSGFSGDGGSATSAKLGNVNGVGVDALGNIYIADPTNCRIRKVTVATGIITTVAGNGTCGYSGDNGLATSAAIGSQEGDIAFDGAGNYYFSDQNNARVREVNISTGVITTVAGTGTAGFSGDGGPATSANLNNPNSVALDSSGNLYLADQNNNRIREVNISTGTITTVAGNGTAGFSGDGGAATSATLNQPYGAVVDAAGNIYIADALNKRVRMVSAATGIISTIAGNGSSSFSGDGGAATLAALSIASDVSLDGAGNLLITDTNNARIRLLTIASGPSIVFSNTAVGASSAATNETVSNIGNATLTVASVSVPANFSLGGASTTCTTGSQTLASAANCVLGIEFAPAGVGPLSGNLTLTDNSLNVAGTTQTISLSGTAIKGTPTVTWATPSAITYGTALNGTQLNATASLPGSFVYSPASGTVPGAGPQTLNVTFTPTDTADYNTATGSVMLTVNQATPTITVATSAASAGYGTAVTFTATLSSGASGTVSFLDSGTSIGTGAISGTTATFTTSSLAVGGHTITVSWPGNTNFVSGTSGALTQTIVRSAVTLSELSSLNPSLYGDAVTLSISATGSGATPTGTVTLTNNGTTVATITLSGSGTASYTTSTLTAATHALTVTYNGDGNYF